MYKTQLKRKYKITDEIVRREKEQVLKSILNDKSSGPKNLAELIRKKENGVLRSISN